MRIRARTLQSTMWAVPIIVAGVSAGCGGVTVLLGGGQPYDGYYYDNFFYDYGGYSYNDPYWYYNDYPYYYDNYSFVDYIDGWYYNGYGDCYYCKSNDERDPTSLKQPTTWDAAWGPWEKFVRARVDFLHRTAERSDSEPLVQPGD